MFDGAVLTGALSLSSAYEKESRRERERGTEGGVGFRAASFSKEEAFFFSHSLLPCRPFSFLFFLSFFENFSGD